MRRDWDWNLRFYYGKRSRAPGALAFETVHKGEVSRDMEIDVGKSRRDIGKIEMRDLDGFEPWKIIYARDGG